DRVEHASLDGLNQEVILTVVYPFEITVHEHNIYWTDWTLPLLIVLNNILVLIWLKCKNDFSYRLMDIHIVSNQHKKCEYSPCNISNGGCGHISNDRRMCILLSSSSASDCNDASDENHTFQSCVYPQCSDEKFTCNNFHFIENFKRCNGYNDCNVTDEISCPPRICNGTDNGNYSDESPIFC
ncbi:unnamed protein product, partial [Rotaria sp. Silwood1]